ncbi:MAG TPA: hypothetical protein VGM87_21155 [Roseomonas sp.]
MAVLKLTLFHTKTVAKWADLVFSKQIEKGNAFLRPYGIAFERYPAAGSIELDWTAPLNASGGANPGLKERLDLRRLANDTYYSTDNRLPVILCQIGGAGGGESPGSIARKLDWAPWVIMDAFTLNNDGLTLTHEAGHCAGLKHPGYPPEGDPRLMIGSEAVTDNIMAYGTFDLGTQKLAPRSLIEPWQVNAYRTAYFHAA